MSLWGCQLRDEVTKNDDNDSVGKEESWAGTEAIRDLGTVARMRDHTLRSVANFKNYICTKGLLRVKMSISVKKLTD